MTPAEIERLIKETAYIPEDWNPEYGSGIINFYNMVKNLFEPEVSSAPLEIKLNSENKIEIIPPEGVDTKIFYTIDNSFLTIDNYNIYTEPLEVRPGGFVSAACHEDGKLMSEVITFAMNQTRNLTLERFKTVNPISDSNALNITWRSFDPDIAKVDEYGNITGVSVGETQIYATLDSGIRITFTVTVEPPWWQQLLYRLFFGFIWMRI